MDLPSELLSLYQNADINFFALQLEKIIMKEWTGGFINRIFPKLNLGVIESCSLSALCILCLIVVLFIFLNFLFIYICLCSDVCYWKLLEKIFLKNVSYSVLSYSIIYQFQNDDFSEKGKEILLNQWSWFPDISVSLNTWIS